MHEGVRPQGITVEAVQEQLQTSLNSTHTLSHFQLIMFPVICCRVACMMFQCHFSLTLGQESPL